jgi:hypothetical protein
MRTILSSLVGAAFLVLSAHAAETRIWTSRKGGTLEATLGGVEGNMVTLVGKDSKQIKLKVEDLSLADRLHLVEFGGAEEAILTGGKPGLVEKETRIDTSAFKRRDDILSFTDSPSEGFELLETPHFLIGTAGKLRPQAVAETAERLWHGMAFVHMNFREDWGDKRMLILLAEDRDTHAALGKWYAAHLAASGNQDGSMATQATWERAGSTSIQAPAEIADKYGIFERVTVFNVKDDAKFRKDLSPFPTHVISGALLVKQMGGVSSASAEGHFALITGHSYFKEISLAGKSETQLLSVEGSQKDEISSARGFEDGTSWARTLRKLVKSGKVPVKFEEMLKWKSSDLTPERLVLIYSFAHYMESDSKRLGHFANMIRNIESSSRIPSPEEFAKTFGFDTVEEFEADWAAFIKDGDFK